MKVMSTIRCARKLTASEQRILKSLMRRKLYDRNHPGHKPHLPILRRVFIPADYEGNPTVLLLCQYTKPDREGRFEFVVYSDGLYGPGHYASDKFGGGTLKDALDSFEEHIVYELIGVWPWVIREKMAQAKRLARDP
jgi:hypothetical protein